MADSAPNRALSNEKTAEESAPKRAKFARWLKKEHTSGGDGGDGGFKRRSAAFCGGDATTTECTFGPLVDSARGA